MTTVTISIAEDFSRYPAGRTPEDGPHNGTTFRDILVAHIKKGEEIIVFLDGTRGYGSSFLDEVFGGIVRLMHWSAQEFKKNITIQNDDSRYDRYREISYRYVDEAANNPEN